MQEQWKDVVGAEGFYQVSDLGNVRSCPRQIIGRQYAGRTLRTITTTNGYLRASISIKGKGGPRYVHRLVASAFLPNPLGLEQVNHLNGKRKDNRKTNLEWCTSGENQAHSYANLGHSRGGRVQGEKHYNCKLSDLAVAMIRTRQGQDSAKTLAEEYQVSAANIYMIWSNKTRRTND